MPLDTAGSNPYDQFDTPPTGGTGGNPYDQFDTPAAKPTEPEGLLSAAGRGFKKSFQQLPQLAYGVGAGLAAGAETVLGEGGVATAAKNAAIEGFTRWQDKIAEHAQENDSIDVAWDKAQEGDVGALVDWLAHGIGYTGGQALQILASGGVGYAAGKVTAQGAAKAIASGMIEKEVTRLAQTEAGKAVVAKVGAETAAGVFAKEATANVAGKIGQTAALGVTAFGMEGGEIFGGLTQANKERALTGGELGRAFGATVAAGGLEFVGDKLGLSALMGKIPGGKALKDAPGLLGRAGRGAAAAAVVAPVEGATEFGQTLLEEYGQGNEDTINPFKVSSETLKQAHEATALGVLGGGLIGGAGGVVAPSPKPKPSIVDAGTPDAAIEAFRFELGDKTDAENILASYRPEFKPSTPEEIAANQADLERALESDPTFAPDAEGRPTAYGAPLRAVAPQDLPTEGEGLTRDAYEAISALKKAQGLRTIVYEDDAKLPDGLVKQPDVVFISNKTSIDPAVVAAHEAQHLSEQGEMQAAYAKVVEEELTENAKELATQRHGEQTPERLAQEIRGDLTGDAWADPTFHGRVLDKMFEQLGAEKAQASATTFLGSIRDLISRVKAVLTGTTFTTPDGKRLATQYVKNLERVHDALAAAIADRFIQKGYRPPGAQTNTSQLLVQRALDRQRAIAENDKLPPHLQTKIKNAPIEAPPDASPALVSALAAAQKAPFDRSVEERLNLDAIRAGVRMSPKAKEVTKIEPTSVSVNDEGSNTVPGQKTAFFGEGEAYLNFTKAKDGTPHLQDIMADKDVRGRQMLDWLGRKYGKPVIEDVVPKSVEYWKKMKAEGRIKSWTPLKAIKLSPKQSERQKIEAGRAVTRAEEALDNLNADATTEEREAAEGALRAAKMANRAAETKLSPKQSEKQKIEASRAVIPGHTVNIGLNIGDKVNAVTHEAAEVAIRLTGSKILKKTYLPAGVSEPTLVATLDRPLTPKQAHAVAVELDQQAIAQYSNGRGTTYGPQADQWQFTPDFFQTHSGQSLSAARAHQVAAAFKDARKDPRTGVALTKAMRAASIEEYKYGDRLPYTVSSQPELGELLQEMANTYAAARTDDTPENREFAARVIEHETRLALEQGGSKNAIGWYDDMVSATRRVAALVHPELATDDNAWLAFTYALAVTSNGHTVDRNVENAFKIYRKYDPKKGTLPVKGFGIVHQAMEKSFETWNTQVAARGVTAWREFLLTKHNVRDLFEVSPNIKELRGDEVYGGTIIGSKIGGGFLQNIHRNFDALTMDRWFMRTWGRVIGHLVEETNIRTELKSQSEKAGKPVYTVHRGTALIDNPKNGGSRHYIRATTQIALERLQKDYPNLTMADLQAILWYEEKDLYTMHGVNSEEPTDYAIETAKYAEARGIDSAAVEDARRELGEPGRRDAGDRPGEVVRLDRADPDATQPAGRSDGRPDGGEPARLSPKAQGSHDLTGVHFSTEARASLSGAYYGTGMKGEEAKRIAASKDGRLKWRTYMYLNTGSGVRPERYVGGQAHVVTFKNLYDADSDLLNLYDKDLSWFEAQVLNAGFDGYFTRGDKQGVAVIIGQNSAQLKAENKGTAYRGADLPVPPARVISEIQQKVQSIAQDKSLPDGQMTGADWRKVLGERAPAALDDATMYYKSDIGSIVRRGSKSRIEPAGARLSPKSPEFKTFMAGSRVTKTGEPWVKPGDELVVYHGTNERFNEFVPSEYRSIVGGIFFTVDRSVAKQFGVSASESVGGRVRVVKAFLSIRNPKVIPASDIMKGDSHSFDREFAAVKKAKAEGYDGLLIKEVPEYADLPSVDQWVVFKPTQIKSAIGNTGAFDPNNPDIRFSPKTPAQEKYVPPLSEEYVREAEKQGDSRQWFDDRRKADEFWRKLRETKFSPKQQAALEKWAGNTKIRNPDGSLQVWYHGTARDISEFKPKQAGAIFLTSDTEFAEGFAHASETWMWDHADQFLTREQEADAWREAQKIARKNKTDLRDEFNAVAADYLPSNANVMPLYVKAENPFDYDDPAQVDALIKLSESRNIPLDRSDIKDLRAGAWNVVEHPDTQKLIKAAGHDGFYVAEAGRKNLAVYDSRQLKSVTGNTGEYDGSNPDIRKSPKNPFPDSKVQQVVYHGTGSDFKEFSLEELGGNTFHPTTEFGFAFTTHPRAAELFAPGESRTDGTFIAEDGAVIYPVWLDVKKPFVMSFSAFEKLFGKSPGVIEDMRVSMELDGYDGVMVKRKRGAEPETEVGEDTWFVFRPEQIKSIFNPDPKPSAKFSPKRVDKISKDFEAKVATFFRTKSDQPVELAPNTPASLQVFGWIDLPIVVEAKVLDKMKFDHGVTDAQFGKLPYLLQRPMFIFADAKNGSLVFVGTDLKPGTPALLAMKPERDSIDPTDKVTWSNMVVTGYSAPNGWDEVAKRLMRGELIYRDPSQATPAVVEGMVKRAQKNKTPVPSGLPGSPVSATRGPTLEVLRGGHPQSSQHVQADRAGQTGAPAVVQSPTSPVDRKTRIRYPSDLVKWEAENWGEEVRFSPKITGASARTYTPAQERMFQKVGRSTQVPTIGERIAAIRQDLGKKIIQGVVDQFAPLKELSPQAYLLARHSKDAPGALEALLRLGKLKIRNGVYDVDLTGGFIDTVAAPLQGEMDDALWWIAAHRAELLTKEDREHLFDKQDIADGKTLADGNLDFDYVLENGQTTRNRKLAYQDTAVKYDRFNKNAMDMAEQSGLIDPLGRKQWERMMYVPFYRVGEEAGAFVGGNVSAKLVGQSPFKRLKGGADKLNSDLMENVIQNWFHLLDSASKNRPAKVALEAAAQMGVAIEGPKPTVVSMAASIGNKGSTVWFLDGGVQRHFVVDDPYVMTAITSLEYAGMKGPIMKALSVFKHVLTVSVTASPVFKVRNLIRDSLQSVATSPLSYNVVGNIAVGLKAGDRAGQTYASALAGGGLIRFGTMLEGNSGARARQLAKMGVKESRVLDSESKVQAVYDKFIEPAWMAYQELGNKSEEINRISLYRQMTDKGMDHATAAFMARDLMDFSLAGSWTAIRFLTQTVPFMNARMQGIYKLGRAAKEDPARFAVVLAATAAFSVALLAAYADDDDWKKREDWDRDNYWWLKIGGIAFRIPKPFEVGAVATLAERGVELATDPEMTGGRFNSRVLKLLSDQLSMNPVPQAVKPWLDVYANKDSFTGRPIESMGMERLQPDYRFTSRTSMAARAASTAGQAVTSQVGVDFLSPVQIDSVLRGYFSWIGSFVVGMSETIARPLSGQPDAPAGNSPMERVFKLATGNFVTSLPVDQSRYVSHMYEQARVIEQAMGTYRGLLKQGKRDEAREFRDENRDQLVKYKSVGAVKRAISKLNERIRIVERSSKTPDEKKEMITALNRQKDRIARKIK